MLRLNQVQEEKIRKYIEQFKERLEVNLSDAGWEKERRERTVLFQDLLAKDNIDNLTEEKFARIIESLWASDLWKNKRYLVGKILRENGLPKLEDELKELLYGDDPIDRRFDRFIRNIKGLGPSSVTEILVFVFPDKYCLWNDKPKNVLPLLGMKDLLPDRVYKYAINGKDYVKCTQALTLVKQELDKSGFKQVDFLDVDIFMWLLFSELVVKERRRGRRPKKKKEEEVKIDLSKLSHWDVMGILLDLGNLLAYDTYAADPSKKSEFLNKSLRDLATLKEIPGFTFKDTLEIVRNIDVIWFKNGEYPEYCFEVEHTTNVRDGLLRLYQISPLKGVGFFVIARSNTFDRFEREVNRKPFREIKNRYTFHSYKELAVFYEEAKKYYGLKGDFLGKE